MHTDSVIILYDWLSFSTTKIVELKYIVRQQAEPIVRRGSQSKEEGGGLLVSDRRDCVDNRLVCYCFAKKGDYVESLER